MTDAEAIIQTTAPAAGFGLILLGTWCGSADQITVVERPDGLSEITLYGLRQYADERWQLQTLPTRSGVLLLVRTSQTPAARRQVQSSERQLWIAVYKPPGHTLEVRRGFSLR